MFLFYLFLWEAAGGKFALTGSSETAVCTVGWVNLYKKFKIEKYTVFGKLVLPKKKKAFKKKKFGHNWLANLHGFANICKLPVSNTFKDMQSKFW